MNNLLSYCGLVDARISASEKDLPVKVTLPTAEILSGKNAQAWVTMVSSLKK